MKVQQLIDALSRLPADARLGVWDGDYEEWRDVVGVTTRDKQTAEGADEYEHSAPAGAMPFIAIEVQ